MGGRIITSGYGARLLGYLVFFVRWSRSFIILFSRSNVWGSIVGFCLKESKEV